LTSRPITRHWEVKHNSHGTNVAEHIEKEIAKAGLQPLPTRLHRLVAFQEMSFTGIVPVVGLAGHQSANFIADVSTLSGLQQPTKACLGYWRQ
jgi:hypothetical protein